MGDLPDAIGQPRICAESPDLSLGRKLATDDSVSSLQSEDDCGSFEPSRLSKSSRSVEEVLDPDPVRSPFDPRGLARGELERMPSAPDVPRGWVQLPG